MSVKLCFPKGRKLRIMQITDTHSTPERDKDTLRLINASLDKVKPDLVVFTGDQSKGYGYSKKGEDKLSKVRTAISHILEPIASRNIPFTVTLGNHDSAKVSAKELMDIYSEYPSMVQAEYVFESSTFSVPVYSSENNEKIALNLYLVDTHTNSVSCGYEPVSQAQVEWLRNTAQALKKRNGSKAVPSFIFQHIPVAEIYNVLKKVPKSTKDAVKAYRIHKGEYYVVGDGTSGLLLEQPSISDINNGEFAAALESESVIGMFFGHDHTNTFIGKYEGIDLGYCPSCGFSEYGNGADRGVRIFEIEEASPDKYSTELLLYKDLFGTKLLKPLKNIYYQHIQPRSVDEGIALVSKLLGIIAVLATIIVLLCKYL